MQESLPLVATPKILQSGKIIIWNNTLYFGNSSNTPTKVSSDTVPTHYHSASDINSGTLSISRGGTGNTNGLAASATKLETARTIRVNLGSTNSVSFDGSANITPGITGTLSVSHGGTGVTSLSSLLANLDITKCVTGTAIAGTGSKITVSLGFQPALVIITLASDIDNNNNARFIEFHNVGLYLGIGYAGNTTSLNYASTKITSTGFSSSGYLYKNATYAYVAFA